MKKLLIFSIALIIFSCDINEREKQIEIQKERAKKIEEQKTQRNLKYEKLLNEAILKYKVLYKWDTLPFQYSYEYQPVIKSNCQIIENYTINDIYLKDTSYNISLNVGGSKSYFEKEFEEMGFFNKKKKASYNFNLSGSKFLLDKLMDKETKNFLLVKIDTIYKYTQSQYRGKGRIIEVFSLSE